MAEVRIFDFNELHALHRALMEAKFSEHLVDTAISGSPYVATVANRVLDALIEMERNTGGDERAVAWERWRQIDPSRREWKIALSRINSKMWRGRSRDEKVHVASILLSPLVAGEEILQEFLEEADRRAVQPVP